MSIDRNAFQIKNTSISDDGEGWMNFLREIFIAEPRYADKYRSLAGTIRIPVILDNDIRPRTKIVNNTDPKSIVNRTAKLNQFCNYMKEKNLKGTDFRYAEIIYTGSQRNGWYEYDNTIVKFIDYILPLLKEKVSNVSVDDVVFTEHASPEKEPVSLHVLYTSAEPCEFTVIWNLYLDFLEQRENKKENSEESKSKTGEEKSDISENPVHRISQEKIVDNNKDPLTEQTNDDSKVNQVENKKADSFKEETNVSNTENVSVATIEESEYIPDMDDLPTDDISSESQEYDELETENEQNFANIDLEPTEDEYAEEDE